MSSGQRMWTGESELALVRVQACPSGGYAAVVFLLDGEFIDDARGPVFRHAKMLSMGFGSTVREAYRAALDQFGDDIAWSDPRAKRTLEELRGYEAPEHIEEGV